MNLASVFANTLDRRWTVSVALTVIAYLVLQVFWITATPIQSKTYANSLPRGANAQISVGIGPDEDQHYLYILSVADQGRLPVPTVVWSKSPEQFVSHEAQHPPLFYLIAAGVYKCTAPFGAHVVWYALRGLCTFFGAIALVLIALSTRILFPNRPTVAFGAAPFIAFLPIFDYMTATVSNLPLELVFTSMAWLLTAKLLTSGRPLTIRSGSMIGIAMGLAGLTRITSLMWLPSLALLLFYVLQKLPLRARLAGWSGLVVCGAIIALFVAPWLIYMKIHFGAFLFRSDYRPILSYISLMQYLAHPHQLLHVANTTMAVRVPPLTLALWFASSSWTPFWLIQYALPNFQYTSGAYQAIFLILDIAIGFFLIRWLARGGAKEAPDEAPYSAPLVAASVLAVFISIIMLLQQEFYVDMIMLAYAGRYTISVLEASTLLTLLAASSITPRTPKAQYVAACVIAAAILLLNLASLHLLQSFYSA